MKKLFIIAIVGALAGGVVQVAASNMKSAEYRGVGMDKGSKPSTMSSNKTTISAELRPELCRYLGPGEAQRAPGSTDPIDHGGVPQGAPEAERAGQ